MPPTPPKTRFEYSAGGIVRDGDNLLMVKVQNLEGDEIWTFPKGHIEKGEKSEEAALREVQEETGYHCEIEKPFERVQYWFKRENTLTKKTVNWFLMRPLKKTGSFDPDEILETKWIPLAEAKSLARYKSDKKILSKLGKP
jgi:ADP-ribose pyrophosphatase YjhB (NUDIX family)